MTERIALFIDGANLHHTAKALGFEVNFKRLLVEFDKHGRISRAYFYTAISDAADFSSIRPLVNWLDYNGYTVRTKPIKEFDDGEGRRKFNRNIGVELAVDMLDIARYVDHIFLFYGDGDLRCLAEAVQRLGAQLTVVSSIRTKPPMAADELRRQADTFIELAAIRTAIERPPHPTAPE